MDLISNLLRSFHLNSSVFEYARFCGHWGLGTMGSGHAVFHLVAGGHCWLHRPDFADAMPMNSGDVLVMPRDSPHQLSDSATVPVPKPTEMRPLGDGSVEGTDIICGYFRFDERVANPLLDALPDYLIIPSHAPGNEALRGVIDLLVKEALDAAPGVEAILDRLSDALFIQAIRAFLQSGPGTGLAAALADPAVHRALQLMHEFPQRSWTLVQLAREVAVSRSALIQRFVAAMGEPPMAYLARWRMTLAKGWLQEGMTVAEVTERCGYASEAGFAKAFKRHLGVGPGFVRRRGQ